MLLSKRTSIVTGLGNSLLHIAYEISMKTKGILGIFRQNNRISNEAERDFHIKIEFCPSPVSSIISREKH